MADGEQEIGIEKVTPHEKYAVSPTPHNDIAILRTKTPMVWRLTEDGFGSVNRICLPKRYQDYRAGEKVTASGWGDLWFEGNSPDVLNAVDLPIVATDECRAGKAKVYLGVNNDHVCAAPKEGGKDTCQGDSGGPLAKKRGGRSELVGIVSFGPAGCTVPDKPAVYTKVSHYIDWIKRNL